MRFAIFASGTGSNAETIIRAAEAGELEGEPAFVFSDVPRAGVLEKAEKIGVPTFTFRPKSFASKSLYEAELVELLKRHGVEWIVLAGYMRLIGSTLLDEYEGKIINIHPSLLPDFPGLDAIGQALDSEVDKTGVTIHYVDNGMDTGPVISQQSVPIEHEETRISLTKKIQEVEHRLYPKTLQQVFTEGASKQ